MSLPTVFTVIFALACVSTFVCGFQKRWKDGRLVSAAVAVLSFLLALFSAGMSNAK